MAHQVFSLSLSEILLFLSVFFIIGIGNSTYNNVKLREEEEKEESEAFQPPEPTMEASRSASASPLTGASRAAGPGPKPPCVACGRPASRPLGQDLYCAACYSEALLLSPSLAPSRCSPAPSTCSSGSWSLVTARSPSQVGASPRSSSLGYGGGEVCARCRDTVYFAERQVGTAGRVYHVRCFRCRACEQRLASGSYRSEGGELYCEPCHRRHLGPRGYGYGLGSALRCFPGRL
ncbi:uncharacterized protein LOC142775975 [Rhipicephalus microplus]|uniref:uncharacterized protein LOC142775975 n=1 Tax=Rhipicephalus microplus TaxID=6941 RepID=UPI003F6B44E6